MYIPKFLLYCKQKENIDGSSSQIIYNFCLRGLAPLGRDERSHVKEHIPDGELYQDTKSNYMNNQKNYVQQGYRNSADAVSWPYNLGNPVPFILTNRIIYFAP